MENQEYKMSLTSLLEQSRQSFSEFWMMRNARERAMLAVAALFVTFSLAYVLLIAPALGGRDQLNKNLPALRQQVAWMQALSKEATALPAQSGLTSNASSPVPSTISREVIDATLARNGLKAQNVMSTGDFVKIQLAAVPFSGILHSLDDMQKNSLLFVVDANIVALAQPDMVNATFTLHQQRNE
jgi:general secretion pathway protein M